MKADTQRLFQSAPGVGVASFPVVPLLLHPFRVRAILLRVTNAADVGNRRPIITFVTRGKVIAVVTANAVGTSGVALYTFTSASNAFTNSAINLTIDAVVTGVIIAGLPDFELESSSQINCVWDGAFAGDSVTEVIAVVHLI